MTDKKPSNSSLLKSSEEEDGFKELQYSNEKVPPEKPYSLSNFLFNLPFFCFPKGRYDRIEFNADLTRILSNIDIVINMVSLRENNLKEKSRQYLAKANQLHASKCVKQLGNLQELKHKLEFIKLTVDEAKFNHQVSTVLKTIHPSIRYICNNLEIESIEDILEEIKETLSKLNLEIEDYGVEKENLDSELENLTLDDFSFNNKQ